MKDNQGLLNPPPVLFFYLSQFFRYIDLVVYSVVHFGAMDLKYMIQEPENFNTDDVLQDQNIYFDDLLSNQLLNESLEENMIEAESLETELQDNSEHIKYCIENNKFLNEKEKNVLLKIYKNSYSAFGCNLLTKRDNDVLISIQKRLQQEPNLLKDLEEILYAK